MISIRNFTGEFPRIPGDKLPDGAATFANACDFAHGELRSLPGLASALTPALSNSAVSLWTENGLNFLSWTYEVDAVPGPVIDDQFERLYYSTGTDTSAKGLRVTQRSQAVPAGGEPASSWKAGVPKPSNAITAATIAAAALPDNMQLTWMFFYEANGVKYEERPISPTTIVLGREYQFAAPDINFIAADPYGLRSQPGGADYHEPGTVVTDVADNLSGTPENAIPCVQVIGKLPGSDSQVFMAYSSNSDFAKDNDTNGFNGLVVTAALASAGVMNIKFTFGAGFKQSRAFVYTAVNLWNEESAPSDAVVLTYDAMQQPRLTLPSVDFVGYVPITRFRVYGSVSGSSGATDYQLVGEVSTAGAAIEFTVSTKPEDWTTLLDTYGHLPPEPTIQCLTLMPGGIMAGITGRDVVFSEAYKPWAWNPENAIRLKYGTVSACLSGPSLIVTTTAQPYIINGTTPDSMLEQPIQGSIQAGAGLRSIVNCGSFVAYATNDGICTVQNGVADLAMGQRFFTREDWRNQYSGYLSVMRFAYYDGCLIAFGGGMTPFIIRFDEAAGSYTRFSTLLGLTAAFILPQTDSLYMVSGTSIRAFGGGSAVSKTWTSKEYREPRPVNFGCLRTYISGSIDITIFADSAIIYTATLTASGTYRLPGGIKAQRFTIELSGTGIVKEIHLAETADQLKNV